MQTQDSPFDVAVVGAGVAGVACALGLSQLGLRVALIGPAPRPFSPSERAPFDERIYALAPATIALLERLNAWRQVDGGRLQPVARMRVFGDRGDELSFDAYGAAVERLATIAEEGGLLRALAATTSSVEGVTRLEQGVLGLAIDAGVAQLALDDGSSLRAALVVGADGAQSVVRAAAGIAADLVAYPHTAVVTNFRISQPHDGVAWQWFCDEGVVALLPLPGPAVSLVWSAPHALADQLLALSPEDLAGRVTRRSQQVLGALSPLGGVRSYPLRRMTVDRLVAPRIALVGDAAHLVHPLAGQGLNLGLQDVSTLLDVIGRREVWRDVGDLTLLRRYARLRAEPIGLIRFTTDSLARLFAVDDPLVRWIRNSGLNWVNRIGPLKGGLIRRALG